jgi:hypothetical protein
MHQQQSGLMTRKQDYLGVLVGAFLGQIQNEQTHFHCVKILHVTRVNAFDNGVDDFQKSFRQQLRGFVVVGSVLRQELSNQLHQVIAAACDTIILMSANERQAVRLYSKMARTRAE